MPKMAGGFGGKIEITPPPVSSADDGNDTTLFAVLISVTSGRCSDSA
jgi:hypothetical protein